MFLKIMLARKKEKGGVIEKPVVSCCKYIYNEL